MQARKQKENVQEMLRQLLKKKKKWQKKSKRSRVLGWKGRGKRHLELERNKDRNIYKQFRITGLL